MKKFTAFTLSFTLGLLLALSIGCEMPDEHPGDSLRARVTVVEDALVDLEAEVEALEDQVLGMDQDQTEVKEAIALLNSHVAQLEANLNTAQQDFVAHEAQNAEAQAAGMAALAAHTQDYQTLKDAFEAFTASSTENADRVEVEYNQLSTLMRQEYTQEIDELRTAFETYVASNTTSTTETKEVVSDLHINQTDQYRQIQQLRAADIKRIEALEAAIGVE